MRDGLWECLGAGLTGYGYTWRMAYEEWRRMERRPRASSLKFHLPRNPREEQSHV